MHPTVPGVVNVHSCPEVISQLKAAMDAHDLEALISCFADGYRSDQPLHPDRAFVGKEQVRRNWTVIFDRVPDFEAKLHCVQDSEGMVWTEWEWQGTGFEWRGVILFGVAGEKIEWARVYMEPVERTEGTSSEHWISRRMRVSRYQSQQGHSQR